MVIRLLLLPLAYLAHRTLKVYRTPWCALVDHDTILDPVSGLMCRRCGHIIRTITPPKDDQ